MRTALILAVFCVICHVQTTLVFGEATKKIPEPRAINALIGECEQGNYLGMLAIAGAIRNRGHLNGVYGEKSPRVVKKKYNQKTLQLAKQAWKDSASNDITKGADHWASKTIDKNWELKMIKNGYIKTYEDKWHVFYKSN